MKLRGVEFGPTFNASGARGFAGEGYWFHKLAFGWPDFTGATFVSKTSTLAPRTGNMKLRPAYCGYGPVERFPDCVVAKPLKGIVLNAVGLSGPGLAALAIGPLREFPPGAPLVVSLMSLAPNEQERLAEYASMASLLRPLLAWRESESGWEGRTAVQVNFSCPNAGIDPTVLAGEVRETCAVLRRELDCSVMVKLGALAEPSKDLDAADAVICSNTIPWGKLPERIDWEGLFGSKESPLARYGGGGLSGKPLLPIVADWIRRARAVGVTVPIIGCGGVLSPKDADALLDAGADGIEIGSAAMLRPWRVGAIIRHVNERKAEGKRR